MPSASLDRPIKQRVKIYPWRSESKCRTKCVHTLALSRRPRAADTERAALDARFRGHECVREDALSARWKSVPEPVVGSVIEGNCVAVRRGGEQPEVNRQSVG